MATRRELTVAVGQRYREASRAEKVRMLDGFVVVTDFHRKHVRRLLRRHPRFGTAVAGFKRKLNEMRW